MKVEVIPEFDYSNESGSDGQLEWLGGAAKHPEIAKHRPQSKYGGVYLCRLDLYRRAVNLIDDLIEHPEFYGLDGKSIREQIHSIMYGLTRNLEGKK